MQWWVAKSGYRVCRASRKRKSDNPEVSGPVYDMNQLTLCLESLERKGKKPPWSGAPSRWWITEAVRFGRLQRNETPYQLDRRPAQFHDFAKTPPNIRGILKFANRYGLLVCRAPSNLLWNPHLKELWYAERVSTWAYHMHRMNWALDVWDMVRDGDREGLARRFYVDVTSGSLIYKGDPEIKLKTVPECPALQSRCIIARRDSNRDFMQRFERSRDFVEAGYEYVVRGINEGLRSFQPETKHAGSVADTRQIFPRLQWDSVERRAHLKLDSETLIAALWLQFAHAVAGGRSYQSCPRCGTWFEVGEKRPGQKRRGRITRKWCSDDCRVLASQERNRGRARAG